MQAYCIDMFLILLFLHENMESTPNKHKSSYFDISLILNFASRSIPLDDELQYSP